MGSFLSKDKQANSERKKSNSLEQTVTSNGRTTRISSVTMTREVQISQSMTSTRTSVNSVTSQSFRSAGTIAPGAAVIRSSRGPRSINNQPSADASKVSIPTKTRVAFSPQIEDIEYDLSQKAYVLVFHHYKFADIKLNREGSAKDMQKIREILSNYRCSTLDINENLTVLNVRKKMREIQAKQFSKNSCLIVFIMSHGQINDYIVGYDGGTYHLHDDIVEQCTANQTLQGKPKIFAVQACRGTAVMETDARKPTVSDKSDIVVFQSSYHGTVSYRSPTTGSSFMQAFLRLLHENNHQCISKVGKLLNSEFKDRSVGQAPPLTITLRKELIFGRLLKSS
ncbi:caspase-3-like isoform X2 [Anopheles stephensi]|uniref:caspase-3-like isoform X2 n=1 Tax=Anopheles stephensi TaxID=30069 RepID=UPI001658890D|nr:caspase-3-like isoform X2 [Anopheles stephensi]